MEILAIPGFSDPVSSLSHLLAAGVFAVLSVCLIRRGQCTLDRVSLGVFGFTCVFLLSMSGIYHLLSPGTNGRAVLLRLDHAAIFALIAGTFTPLHVILFKGWRRWLPLLAIWGCAVIGISLKSIVFDSIPEWLSTGMYLVLGWMGLFSSGFMWQEYGREAIRFPLYGGIAYTIGAVADFLRWPIIIPGVIGPHELFHIAVLFGVCFFWVSITQVALARPPFENRMP